MPERRQRVQTLIRCGCPSRKARTVRRFGRHSRLVTLCAWEMRLPPMVVLPQISHARAIRPPPSREGAAMLAWAWEFAKRVGHSRCDVLGSGPSGCRLWPMYVGNA